MIFDIEKAFKNSGIARNDFNKILDEVRQEFPNDSMMYELHVIRCLHAFKEGYWKPDN